MINLNLAICDDEPVCIELLKAYIEEYSHTNGLCITIDTFTNEREFLASTTDYDIIFMDIYIHETNGIDIIRKTDNSQACIIFVTGSKDFAVEAFSLNAIHYLLKPVDRNMLTEALDRCIERKPYNKKTIEVKSQIGNVPIPMKKVNYIEVFNKTSVIYLSHTEIRTHSSLDSIMQKLDTDIFFRPQRSYIVNMNYIESFYSDYIVLKNKLRIQLSRKNKTSLKKQYQNFLFYLARGGNEYE